MIELELDVPDAVKSIPFIKQLAVPEEGCL